LFRGSRSDALALKWQPSVSYCPAFYEAQEGKEKGESSSFEAVVTEAGGKRNKVGRRRILPVERRPRKTAGGLDSVLSVAARPLPRARGKDKYSRPGSGKPFGACKKKMEKDCSSPGMKKECSSERTGWGTMTFGSRQPGSEVLLGSSGGMTEEVPSVPA